MSAPVPSSGVSEECEHVASPEVAIGIAVGVVVVTVILQGILQRTLYAGWREWYDAQGFWPPAKSSGWAFFIAWIIIVYPTQIAARVLSLRAQCSDDGAGLLILYVTESVLNNCWSALFFGMRDAQTSVPIIVTELLINVIITGVVSANSSAATILMSITLVWLTIATMLNVAAARTTTPAMEFASYSVANPDWPDGPSEMGGVHAELEPHGNSD